MRHGGSIGHQKDFLRMLAERYLFFFFAEYFEDPGISHGDLFEGDMLLSAGERSRAERGLDPDGDGARAAIRNRAKLWPRRTIPYALDPSVSRGKC